MCYGNKGAAQMSDVSKNIKKFRKKSNLTQEELALQLNVTRQTVSNWETDKSYPDLDMLITLATALDTDTNSLLYPPEARAKVLKSRPVSFKSVLITVIVLFLIMSFGAGIFTFIFQPIIGGNVATTFIYPIYGGIIILAALMVGCTCVIVEKLGTTDFYKDNKDEPK